MKILFFGDIVGRIGRLAVSKALPEIKDKYHPDFIIANAENLSHGSGVTEKNLKEMQEVGIDFFTSGNHIWARKNIEGVLNQNDTNLIRPFNYPYGAAGHGYKVINIGINSIIVLNLMGRVFMKECVDCPFKAADEIIALAEDMSIKTIIIDFHAEATSEKVALFKYLDGKVSAIIGTHTHIPTNDAQISENGTAYITDAGGCYDKDTVIGVKKEGIIKNFLTQIPQPHSFPKTGICTINAVYIEFGNDGKAKKIKPIINEVEI